MKFIQILSIALCLLVCGFSGPAFAEIDPIDQALDLMNEDRNKEAFDLLQKAALDNKDRREDPEFLLAFADAASAYAEGIPDLNGGAGMRLELYEGAVDLYRMVLANEKADSFQIEFAQMGLDLMRDLFKFDSGDALEAQDYGHAIRVSKKMNALWPDDLTGALLLTEAGTRANNQEVRLDGLRLLVALQPADAAIYEQAASAEHLFGDGIDAALRHLDDGLGVLPGDMKLLAARMNLQAGDPERWPDILKTMEVFEEAYERIQDVQQRAGHAYTAGLLYSRMAMRDQAIERFSWVSKVSPDAYSARAMLGTTYLSRAEARLDDMENLPQDDRKQRESIRKLAFADLDLAREELEYVNARTQPDVVVLGPLASIYRLQGDDAALAKIQSDLDQLPSLGGSK